MHFDGYKTLNEAAAALLRMDCWRDDWEQRMKDFRATFEHIAKYHMHDHVWKADDIGVAECECGARAENWYCPDSPSHLCSYEKGDLRGQPRPTAGIRRLLRQAGGTQVTDVIPSSQQVSPETLAAYRNDIVPLGHFCGVGGKALLALLDYIDALSAEVLRLNKLVADHEEVHRDHQQLVRDLDVLLNGDGAARQASLCDIVAQLARAKHPETTTGRSVTLNGYQLRNALEFCAPDNDADQLESEVSIQWGDAGHSGAGYYACCTEYPEEGSILLDDKPAESSPKTSTEGSL